MALEIEVFDVDIELLQGELKYHHPLLGDFLERCRQAGVDNCPIDEVLDYLALDDYTLYKEVVLGMLTRKKLKEKFRQCEVYTDTDLMPKLRPRLARAAKIPESFSAKVPKRKARSAKNRKRTNLDYYSLCQLLKYLPDEDLANLLIAFRKSPGQNIVSLDSFIQFMVTFVQNQNLEMIAKHAIYPFNPNECIWE